MIWLLYLTLLAFAALGLLFAAMLLPGLWLTTSVAAAYAALTHERFLGIKSLITIFALTVAADFLESYVGRAAALKSGGGRHSILGAAIGGTAGGIFFTFIPIPIISTILGVCLGVFVGASCGEFLSGKHPTHSLRVGLSAAKGKVFGLAAKLVLCAVMWIVIAWTAFP
jgi:uncharacterized protein YqgC (DUF456 family)